MAGPEEVFVGRRRELNALRAEFSAVRAGEGRIALLSGEPGIGKTRTATEISELAGCEGADVAWGRCHEEAGAPPYWPWTQVIRACAARLDPAMLSADLGAGAPDIADLVPEIRTLLPHVQREPGPRDPAEARFRLFDSITRFLLAQTRRRTLVVVLDDLHWADAPSLRLLEFLAPEIGRERLLLIGTYRENELSRRHRLSDTLGALTRTGAVSRLRLTGLDAEEVRHFVALAADVVPPAALVHSLYQQTEGNPLFLREIVRFLHEQGRFDDVASGRLADAAMRMPAGVREVIGRRLNRLSPSCNAVLCLASVIGREFPLDVLLRAATDRDEEEISAAIDEALEARLLEEITSGHYQFAHALIRMTLYDELRAGQRRRLHRAVGEAIETLHRRDLDAVLGDLAHHFHEAAFGGDVARAIDYTIRAGRQANATLAFEDAVVCFQSALNMLEQDPAATEDARCSLLFALGDSQRKINDFATAQATLREAAAIARSAGLGDLLCDIALSYELAEWHRGYSVETTTADLLEEARRLLPEGISTRRIRITSVLARARMYAGAVTEAQNLMREAVRLARGSRSPLIDAHYSILNDFPWGPEDSEELRGYAIEIAVAARAAGDLESVSRSLFRAAVHSLEVGLVDECAAMVEEMRQVDTRLREPALRYFDIGLRVTLALLRGDLSAAETVILEGLRLRAPDRVQSSDPLSVGIFALRREQGRITELRPLVQAFAQRGDAGIWLPGLALMQLEFGDLEAARAILERLAAGDFAALPRDGRWTASLVYLTEVCAGLGATHHAAALYDRLLPWARRNIVVGGGSLCPGCTDRFLGLLAATMRRWDDAEHHFDFALAMNERCGALAPLAHTRHDFARMLLERGCPGDRERALGLLREAQEAAGRLGLAALAQAVAPLLDAQPVGATGPDNLTAREMEVLRLLSIGRSNADIALVLSISLNTVATHVRNILAKTGCANRTEAAAYAMRQGLRV